MKRKESCVRTGRGRGRGRDRERNGGQGAFFKGVIDSLNALVPFVLEVQSSRMTYRKASVNGKLSLLLRMPLRPIYKDNYVLKKHFMVVYFLVRIIG